MCTAPSFCVCQDDTTARQGVPNGVHGSLMVALEHSSGAVRARAVEQLSRALSAADVADTAGELKSGISEDLLPALLRRLQDEDPEVVLAITGSDSLVQQVLLRPPGTSSEDDVGEVTDVSDFLSSLQRAAVVASTSAAAAAPWLSALSEARPKHSVASSGRVLSGLVRLVAAAATTAASAACGDVGKEGLALASEARDAALSLFLECLPGPSAIARVKLAQQLAPASVGGSDVSKEGVAAAASAGKACKKAMRAVSRAAVEAVSGLSTGAGTVGLVGLFAGLATVLEQEEKVENKVFKPPSKSKGKKSKVVDAKGLKAMGEAVCDVLAAALVGASQEESNMNELQVTRWYTAVVLAWCEIEKTTLKAVSQ